MGGISRAKFYADLLPHLDTVHIGSRHFVVVKSMDRLIEKLKDAPAPDRARGAKCEPRIDPAVTGSRVRS
jgi:hypothetical protein